MFCLEKARDDTIAQDVLFAPGVPENFAAGEGQVCTKKSQRSRGDHLLPVPGS